jgi:hypothetical protein
MVDKNIANDVMRSVGIYFLLHSTPFKKFNLRDDAKIMCFI